MFGMGHLSRNLVLAEIFSANNFKCKFLIKTDEKDMVLSFLKSRKSTSIQTIFLSEEINSEKDIGRILEHYEIGNSFLVLDHYDHDLQYQKELKKAGVRWAQFDYKRKDPVVANIVINPNVGVSKYDYKGLIGDETKLCVGESFAIVNEVFKKTKVKPQRDRILIAMGGGEYPKEVVDMITALVLNKQYKFDVITTHNTLIRKLEKHINVEVHQNSQNIAEIYARNQAAIVAGGVTSYELAFLDIPMIVVPYTDNQRENAEKWQIVNHAIAYTSPKKFNQNLQENTLKLILSDLTNHYKKRSGFIDGKGAKRIVEFIKQQANV